jgi:hypothetical protein
MSKDSKETSGTKKSLLEEMLERKGFLKVDPPKDFVRVIFPKNPPGFAEGIDPDERKP